MNKEEIFEGIKTICNLICALVIGMLSGSFLIEVAHYGTHISFKEAVYGTAAILLTTTGYFILNYRNTWGLERKEAQGWISANIGAIFGAWIVLYSWQRQIVALDRTFGDIYLGLFLGMMLVLIAALGVQTIVDIVRQPRDVLKFLNLETIVQGQITTHTIIVPVVVITSLLTLAGVWLFYFLLYDVIRDAIKYASMVPPFF